MTLEGINIVEKETHRFLSRIKDAKERITNDSFALQGSKETGALKRSALDMKLELTRITR